MDHDELMFVNLVCPRRKKASTRNSFVSLPPHGCLSPCHVIATLPYAPQRASQQVPLTGVQHVGRQLAMIAHHCPHQEGKSEPSASVSQDGLPVVTHWIKLSGQDPSPPAKHQMVGGGCNHTDGCGGRGVCPACASIALRVPGRRRQGRGATQRAGEREGEGGLP